MKRSLVRILAALVLSCAALSCAALAGAAETFPSNVIRIFVPFSVGTPSDIISRLIATELSESEGWRFAVEDRPGAVGTIAGSEVLRQVADGHSLYLMNAPVTAAPALLPNMPYDLILRFAPVVRISTSYNVLVVNPSVPAKSIGEFTALLKSRPNEMAFSSAGYGLPAHLIGELFDAANGRERATRPLSAVSSSDGGSSQRHQSIYVHRHHARYRPHPVRQAARAGRHRAASHCDTAGCADREGGGISRFGCGELVGFCGEERHRGRRWSALDEEAMLCCC